MPLAGKTALVTGSTSGIGLAIAEAFAEAGANVVTNGRKENKDAFARVARFGTRVTFDPADMLRHNQIMEMIERTGRDIGAIDILVNNAGIQHVAPIHEFPMEKWDAIIAINLTAPFIAMRAVIPLMRDRGKGRIINMCSAHSLVASPNKSAYVAAKHGLAGLTKVAALELAGTCVTVNAVSPGYVLTPLVQRQLDLRAEDGGMTTDEAQDQILEPQPSGEFVSPADVAALVLFLAGDAAGSITGANYSIDGGWTAE